MAHNWRPACRGGALKVAGAALFYLLFALIFTYPLATHLGSGILRGLNTEDAFEGAWVVAWVQHALLTQHLALFNAPIFYPTPDTLAYQDNLIPIAVLTLPLNLLLHNPLIVYNIALIAAFPASALAMYALAYHLSRRHDAAFLAGLIFAYGPYREAHIEHLNQSSAEAVPLIILAFELARIEGGNRRWLLFGLSLVLCTTLSIYYLMFTVLALGCYMALLRFRRATVISRAGRRGMAGLALGLGCEAVALLPYLGTQHTVGAERKLHEVVFFSSDIRDFLHTGPQSLLYGWSDGFWRIAVGDVHQYMFPGWTALALAILGAWWAAGRRKESSRAAAREWPPGRAYLTMAAVMALLEMGPYLRIFGIFTHFPLPYMAVYTLLPGYAGFRDIGRMDQVMLAFLAGAAAIGAARLLGTLPARWSRRALPILTLLIVLESWVIQRPLYPVRSGSAAPPVYQWLARQPAGVVAELPMCDLRGPYCLEESTYMYESTYHWHPLVNGGGGFFPTGWDARTAILDSFPSAAAVATLRSLDVRYLVVHPNYPNWLLVRHAVQAHRISALGGVPLRLGDDLVIVMGRTNHDR